LKPFIKVQAESSSAFPISLLRGIRERVKKYKGTLKCNRPSLLPSQIGARGKNKSHCFPFFYFPSFLKIEDFIYVKKSKAKKFTLYFIKTCYH